MPDVQELSAGDMDVVERMKSLPDDVLFGDEEKDPKAGQVRSDEPEAPNEIRDEPEASEEEAAQGDKGKSEEQGEASFDVDQEFVISDPEGGEGRTVKLSELLAIEQEYTAFKDEKAAVIERVQTEARGQAGQFLTAQREAMTQVGHQLQAVLQLIQPPPPPNLEMLSPSSVNYNPEQYLLQKAQHDQIMATFGQVRGHAQQLAQRAEQIAQAQKSEQEEREMATLQKAWPEFAKPEFLEQAVNEACKFYGLTPQQLDEGFNFGWQGLMLRDALAYRKMKAGGGDVKAKVVAKAANAKVTASNAGQRTLSTEQSSYMNARKALKSNGKDMAAAARGFARFLD